MLTKGEIQTINYNSNTGTVRVPLFESSGNKLPVLIDAIFAIPPGVFNGYKVGDIVEVGFENNELTPAVVVGKLYLGANIETQNSTHGSLYGDRLQITGSAILPVSTEFTSIQPDNVARADTNLTSIKSVADIINEINKLKTKVSELESKLNNN